MRPLKQRTHEKLRVHPSKAADPKLGHMQPIIHEEEEVNDESCWLQGKITVRPRLFKTAVSALVSHNSVLDEYYTSVHDGKVTKQGEESAVAEKENAMKETSSTRTEAI